MNENEKNVNTTEETTTEETNEANTTEKAVEQMAEEDMVAVFMKMLADNTAAINSLTETATRKAKKRNLFVKIGIGVGGFALGTAAGVAAIKTGLI